MTHDQWCLQQIRAARWFGGKDRPVRLVGLTALPWWQEPAADRIGVRSEIAEVRPAGGRREFYHLLLAEGPGAAGVRDATDDPEACRVLWEVLRTGSAAVDRSGATSVRLVDALPPAPQPRRFTGEQSNTSVLYGDVALLKVFRRLVPGHNPDVEVHDRLTRRNSAHTGRLLGVVRGRWVPGTAGPHDAPLHGDLAMLVEQFADPEDGWQLALASCAAGTDFGAGALGEAVGRVHALLADAYGTDRIDRAGLAQRLRSRVEHHRAATVALEPYAAALRDRVDALRDRGDALGADPVPVQRIHGDAHLGQALRSDGVWKLIDFEGEPGTPVADRVLPDSPVRDVAGFLRSFSYAAAMAPGAGPGAEPAARRDWLHRVRADFVAGWARTAPVPYDRRLVLAYEAERAAYEVGYETRNRPDWVTIPLRDLARLTTQEVTG